MWHDEKLLHYLLLLGTAASWTCRVALAAVLWGHSDNYAKVQLAQPQIDEGVTHTGMEAWGPHLRCPWCFHFHLSYDASGISQTFRVYGRH